MNELRKWMLRLRILIVRQLRAPSFWLIAGLILLMQVFFGSLALPAASNRVLGVFSEGEAGEAAAQKLLAMDTVYQWKQYDSDSSLIDAVTTGEADCGFIFRKALDEALSAAVPSEGAIPVPDLGESVEYVRSTTTTKGEAAKEEVYRVLLEETAPVILRNAIASGQLLQEAGEEAQNAALAEMQQVIEEDALFHVRFEIYGAQEEDGTAEGAATEASEGDATGSPGQESETRVEEPEGAVTETEKGNLAALTGILVFAAALFFAAVIFRADTASVALWFREHSFLYLLMETAAPLIPACVPLVIYLLLKQAINPEKVVLLILLLLPTAVFAVLFARHIRHEAVYLFLSVFLIAAAVIFCFTAGSLPFLRTIEYIRYLLPSTWISGVITA